MTDTAGTGALATAKAGGNASEIATAERFLAAAQASPAAVIVGYPVYDESVPALRL